MVLAVSGLSVAAGQRRLLDEVQLNVPAGRVVAVVGGSGAGKTTLGYAALGQPRPGLVASGSVRLDGQELLGASGELLRCARTAVAGHLPQQPAAVLDPVRRCSGVLAELARLRHRRRGARAQAMRTALRAAGFNDPRLSRRYPHQLSGGQQQRMALAMALVIGPRLLVLDEPTTGLDAVQRAAWRERISRLVASGSPGGGVGGERSAASELGGADEMRRAGPNGTAGVGAAGDVSGVGGGAGVDGMAVLLLTHDLTTVHALADEVVCLRAGRVVDRGTAETVLPSTPLSSVLPLPPSQRLSSQQSPSQERGSGQRRPAPFERSGQWSAPFLPSPATVQPREPTSPARTRAELKHATTPVAAARGVTVRVGRTDVVYDVELEFSAGSRTLLLGASGAGKTTFARALAGLTPPCSGTVEVDGAPLPAALSDRTTAGLRGVQYVHQDPRAAFEKYTPALDQIAATARLLRRRSRAQARAEALELTAALQLTASEIARVPSQLSGGQLQRCALARALLARPRLLLADEATSACDAQSRSAVLQVLGKAAQRDRSAIVLIGHDLANLLPAVEQVAVFAHGRCVEHTTAETFQTAPATSAGAELLQAVAGS